MIAPDHISSSSRRSRREGSLDPPPITKLPRFPEVPIPSAFPTRWLLLFCLIAPIILGSARFAGERLGFFSEAEGVALLTLANIALLLGLVWASAQAIRRTEQQRRQAHAALRESEAFYHSLVETLPQNILRKDQEGRFNFVNRQFCETSGRSFDEIVGQTDADLFPRALAEKYRADDLRVMREGHACEMVEEHVMPDGQTHYVQVIKIPLRDLDGQVNGIQAVFWDVSERWRSEARLKEQNEQLQQLAESERRTHEELKQAQSRMVQTAKLAGLGEMVAGVAHEINNPLSYVSNNVAVLQRDLAEVLELISLYQSAEPLIEAQDPEVLARIREFAEKNDTAYTLSNLESLLARTRDGLKRIQRIVGDLRIFARMDTCELTDLDLNAGLESTVNIVAGNAKAKHVSLDLDLAPLPLIQCFGAKLNQVVMNLVSNAIDACQEGGHVTVRTRSEESGVRIEIDDDGCGIPAELHDRIFDPFFTTKPVGVGTGLGLSISYGIVQDHGGSIEVDSSPGQGTRFTVRLPIRPTGRPQKAEQPKSRRFADVGHASESKPARETPL